MNNPKDNIRAMYNSILGSDLAFDMPRISFLLQKVAVKWEDDSFPAMAAVSFDKTTNLIRLHLKETYLLSLPESSRRDILKSIIIHEAGHLIYFHLASYHGRSKNWEKRITNEAQDLYLNHRNPVVVRNLNEINEKIESRNSKMQEVKAKYEPLLDEARKKGDNDKLMDLSRQMNKETGGFQEASSLSEFWSSACLFDNYKEQFDQNGVDFATFMTLDSTRIYHILMKQEKKRRDEEKKKLEDMLSKMSEEELEEYLDNMKNQGSFDSHDGLEVGDLDVGQHIKQKLRDSQKDFVRSGKKPGSGEGDISQVFEDVNSSKTNWAEVLEHFIASNTLDTTIRTWTRRNRRHPNQTPGRRKDHAPTVVFGIDLSGSMFDDDTMGMMKNQLKQLLNSCEKVWVVGGDTRETVRFEVESVDQVDRLQFIGGGGTDLQFVWEAAKELGADGVVCQTDGYLFDNLQDHKIPSIFFIYPGGQPWREDLYRNILIDNCR